MLDLFNRAPNEYQTPGAVIEALAKELVYCGEAILRVHRDGNVPRRLYILPAEAVTLNDGVSSAYAGGYQGAPIYNYATEAFTLNPDLPQVMHLAAQRGPVLSASRPSGGVRHGRGDLRLASTRACITARCFGREARLDSQSKRRRIAGDVSEKETRQALQAFTAAVKSHDSWQRTAALPAGWETEDLGAKGRDPMLTMAARLIDEKLSAAYGVPIIYLNNLERATYANARQMLAILGEGRAAAAAHRAPTVHPTRLAHAYGRRARGSSRPSSTPKSCSATRLGCTTRS